MKHKETRRNHKAHKLEILDPRFKQGKLPILNQSIKLKMSTRVQALSSMKAHVRLKL